MGNITVEHQGGCTVLVYELESGESLDSLSLGMLSNNEILGVAKASYAQRGMQRCITFHVDGKVRLEQIWNETVSREQILRLFSEISSALLLAKNYMLDPNTFLLDQRYIYVDIVSWEVAMICLPLAGGHRERDVHSFFRELMFTAKFAQNETDHYIVPILNALNHTSAFSVMQFKKIVDELLHGEVSVLPQSESLPLQTTVIQEEPKPMTFWYLLMHYSKGNVAIYREQKRMRKKAKKKEEQERPPANVLALPDMANKTLRVGETTVLCSGVSDETTLLCASEQFAGPCPHLIRIKTQEKVRIYKERFCIGKEAGAVDYCVEGNVAISRRHASIITRNGGFYIVDTQSTNHTYVNEMLVSGSVEMRLPNPCRIRLANEEFLFQVM